MWKILKWFRQIVIFRDKSSSTLLTSYLWVKALGMIAKVLQEKGGGF